MDGKDEQLLKKIAQKDADAFQTLYQKYGLEILRFLMNRLETRAQAEDVLQQVMVVVWQQASTYKAVGSARGWMYGIARNLSAQLSKKPPINEVELHDEYTVASPSPEETTERYLKQEHIRMLVREIPLIERQVIEAVYFRGLTIHETADFLSIPENTVKTRLFRARKRLKTLLVDHYDEYT